MSPTPTAARTPRRRRVGALSVGLLAVVAALVLVARTRWFSQRVAERIQREVSAATGLDVRIGRVSFSFWDFAVRVDGVSVGRAGAPRLARVDSLMVAPSPQDLVRGRVQLSRVSVEGAEVDLRFEVRDGRVVLANGPVSRGGGGGGGGELPFRDIDLSDVRVRVHHPDLGDLTLDSVDVDLLNTPNRRLMVGVLASGGSLQGPRLSGPIRRLEARLALDQQTGDLRVALAHVAVGRLALAVREARWSPRAHQLDLDARFEGPIEDVLRAVPARVPDIRGVAALDVRGGVNLATMDFRADADVDVRDLALHAPDSTDHSLILRYDLGERVRLRVEANRERLIAHDLRARWSGADVTSPAVTLGLTNGFPLTADLTVRELDFTKLMKNVTVTDHTIVLWTLNGLLRLHGALDPMRLVFDIPGLETANFAILRDGWDRGPQHAIIRIPRARISGAMIIDDDSIGWYGVAASFAHTRFEAERIRVRTSRDRTGRDKDIQISGVVSDHIDLADLATVNDIPIAGIAHTRASVLGNTDDPIVTGTLRIEDFAFNTFPLGTLETAPDTHWTLRNLRVEAPRITGRHRRSPYELHRAYLDFSRWTLAAGACVTSPRMQLGDFYNMFHFEGDPTFTPYDGVGAIDAQVDYALGRPGDDRDGVMTVGATLADAEMVAFGEHIDHGSARIAYEWFRRREGVRGARVSVDYLRGTKGGAPIEVSGAMDPGARMHFVASAQRVPLRSMDLLQQSEAPVSGTASVSISVEGTPDAPRVLGDVSLRDLSALGRSLGAVDLRVSQVPDGPPSRAPGDRPPAGRITLDTRLLDDRVRVHAALRVPWEEGRWRDVTGVDHRDYSRAWGRSELSGTLSTTEAVDVLPWLPPTVLARAGADATARTRLTAVIERARLDDVPRADGRVVIDALEAGASGLRATLGTGAPLVVCARAGSFWIAAVAERDGCGPTPAALASGATLSVAAAPFDLTRPLLIGPGGVRVWLAGGGVVGATPADATRLFGSVRAELDLARAASLVPSLTWGRGVGVLAADVAWDGAQPNLSGSVQMHDASVGVAGLPAPVSNVDLDVRLRGSDVVVEAARARYGAATVDASGGRVHLERTQVERIDVPVRVRNLVLSSRDGLPDGVEVGADADLLFSREQADEPALLSGDVTVTRGRFTRPSYLSFDLAGRLGGDGASSLGQSAPAAAPYDPANDWLRFDVAVHMPTAFRVANNLIDADIRFGQGRPFTVVGTNQRYGILGTLEIPRGVMHLNETDFEIRRARIDFDNPERIAPAFDLLAQTEIRRTADTTVRSQWRVNLHAYGTPDRVNLDWSAEPSLSLEDIVLLLFFRLTRAEMERVGGINAAQAVGIEVLSRGLGLDRVIQSALPFIDEFRPGSTYNNRSGIIEPSLSIGGRITDWLRWGGMTTLSAQPLAHGTLDLRLGRSVGLQIFLNNATNQVGAQLPNAGVDVRWRLLR